MINNPNENPRKTANKAKARADERSREANLIKEQMQKILDRWKKCPKKSVNIKSIKQANNKTLPLDVASRRYYKFDGFYDSFADGQVFRCEHQYRN